MNAFLRGIDAGVVTALGGGEDDGVREGLYCKGIVWGRALPSRNACDGSGRRQRRRTSCGERRAAACFQAARMAAIIFEREKGVIVV